MLHSKIPLLHVRPGGLIGYGCCSEWAWSALRARADVRVAHDYVHGTVLHQRRWIALEGFGVCFVAVHMLEENAITSSNGPFPVSTRIVGEPNARAWVHQLVLHAARRSDGNARKAGCDGAALLKTVELVGCREQQLLIGAVERK